MQPAAERALVALQAEGSATPLFCVHAQSGEVRLYEDLARHLAPSRPVYGLRALEPGERGDRRVEAMTARYAREIREFQSGGPYLVVGECRGGMLAYELARQLRSLGEEVSLLVLIDAYPPGEPRLERFVPAFLYRAIHRLHILWLHVVSLLELETGARREYVARRARRVSRTMAARMLGLRGVRSPQSASEAAFAEAVTAYRPTPYTGPAILFRAARLPWGLKSRRDLGWGRLLAQLEVEHLAGYFGTNMSEPRVRSLADKLAAHI